MAKGKVTLQMLSEMMASNSGRTKSSAEMFVRTFFTTVKEALQQDNLIKIKGFGTFKLVVVSPRESINVNTGERVNIAGYNKITFTPDKTLKDRVNRAFAQFDTMVLDDEDISIVSNSEDTPNEEAKIVPLMEAKAPVVEEKEEPATPAEEPAPAEAPAPEEPAPAEKPVAEEPAPAPAAEPAPTPEPKAPQRKSRTWMIILAVLFAIGLAIGLIAALTSGNKETVAEPATKTAPDSIVMTPEQKAEQAARDSIAQLREAAKDYEQVEDGDMLIAGTRTYRKITPSHNLTRYCLQIYGTKKVLPYVMKFNNLRSEYVPVGKVVKFPILVEK
ncbi:MAG: HU family DNA-binding protein [Bacteroidaceae bacterium]|nr:HU family DNA-binding protein [Bacteroidaceae bacterium]